MPISNPSSIWPSAKVRSTASQSIPNTTHSVLTWNQSDWCNTPSMFTGAAMLIAPMRGIYMASAFCRFNSQIEQAFLLDLVKGGDTTSLGIDLKKGTIGVAPVNLMVSIEIALNPGEYIQSRVFHATGATLNTLADAYGPTMSLTLLSPNI